VAVADALLGIVDIDLLLLLLLINPRPRLLPTSCLPFVFHFFLAYPLRRLVSRMVSDDVHHTIMMTFLFCIRMYLAPGGLLHILTASGMSTVLMRFSFHVRTTEQLLTTLCSKQLLVMMPLAQPIH
jgi:hypothetical protein